MAEATDWIGVKVGYATMSLDEYIEAGDWHISDIEALLPVYEEAYSFFQSPGSDGYDQVTGETYKAIVDSAHGFYLSDLLNLARIYPGDIYNLKFYTDDVKGIRSAFDYSSLFATRYYFENLPSHRRIIYDPILNTIITGYDFSEAWNYAKAVSPMMAIEDNWVYFTQDSENAEPDFTIQSTASRFRLLFGQTTPLESLTGKSDYQVRWVYVTLYGSPEIGEMPELDGELGSHTVEMTISAYNEDIRDALEDYMQLYSSDDTVLVIDHFDVIASDLYSDQARVIIYYDIIGEGEASISAGFGKNAGPSDTVQVTKTVDSRPAETQRQEPEEESASQGEEESAGEEGGEEDPSGASPGDEPASEPSSEGAGDTPEKETDAEQEQETENDIPVETARHEEESIAEAEQPGETDAAEVPDEHQNEEIDVPDSIDVEEVNIAEGKMIGYLLSRDIADMLNDQEAAAAPKPEAVIDREIDQVMVNDNSEQEENRRKKILIFTGLACLLVCIAGGCAEAVSFRLRLRR